MLGYWSNKSPRYYVSRTAMNNTQVVAICATIFAAVGLALSGYWWLQREPEVPPSCMYPGTDRLSPTEKQAWQRRYNCQ